MKSCPSCHRHVHAPEPVCPFCRSALPSTRHGPVLPVVLGLTLAACGPAIETPGQGDGDESGTTSGSGTSGSTTSASTVGTSSTGIADTGESGSSGSSGFDTGSSDDNGASSVGFYGGPGDTSFDPIECDPWQQDCPEGEKCVPWANDGSDVWNALRCSPLDPSPDAPGEACAVEGSGVSGIDSCELGALCFFVDPATNLGTCVPQCGGSEAVPLCDDADDRCLVTNGGVLNLCLPSCDPLLQSCAAGQVCVAGDSDFVCMPAASAPAGDGEPCDLVYECEAGSACVDADALAACDGVACCAPLCDPNDAEACTDLDAACVPWTAGADVGFCGVEN